MTSSPKEGAKGFALTVLPTRENLLEAICLKGHCNPTDCWHYVAINKLMDRLEPNTKHHVRIDGGHCKLNYRGWRYVADTPSHVKRSIMLFDRKRYDEVRIREYTLRFHRTTQITEYTKERKQQIYTARDRRIAEGRNEYSRPTNGLRARVQGFSGIV